MLEKLILNHYEIAAVILSGIGLMNLLLQRNLIRKIIGLNIMNTAVYLLFAAKGYNAEYPPVPAGLILTGIVVTVSVTAFALALTLKLYETYGTLNIDEALMKMTLQQEELEAKIEAQEEELIS